MENKEYKTESPEETRKIAFDLGSSFKGGEVLLAEGPLGAGKTAFAKGLGEALGIQKIINSPTFDLIKVYKGSKLSLYHVDCYRLETADEERKDLGLDEVLGDPKIVTYIEWPMYGGSEILGYHPVIRVKIDVLSEKERKVTIQDER